MNRKHHRSTERLPKFKSLADQRCEPFQGSKKANIAMRYFALKYLAVEVAEQVGCSASYVYDVINKYKKDSNYRANIHEDLKGHVDDFEDAMRAMLPSVIDTKLKIIEKMKEDPEAAMKHPQVLKLIMQGAGVQLNENPVPQPQTIHINTLQVMQQMVANDIRGGEPDAEVIDAQPTKLIEDKD